MLLHPQHQHDFFPWKIISCTIHYFLSPDCNRGNAARHFTWDLQPHGEIHSDLHERRPRKATFVRTSPPNPGQNEEMKLLMFISFSLTVQFSLIINITLIRCFFKNAYRSTTNEETFKEQFTECSKLKILPTHIVP